MLQAISTNLLRSGARENAQRSSWCVCAFRKPLIHNIFAQLILHMRLFKG